MALHTLVVLEPGQRQLWHDSTHAAAGTQLRGQKSESRFMQMHGDPQHQSHRQLGQATHKSGWWNTQPLQIGSGSRGLAPSCELAASSVMQDATVEGALVLLK